jgi:uncharacterized protein YkwD
MTRVRGRHALFLLLALAAAWSSPLRAQASLSPSDFQGQVEKQTFQLINAYRDRDGLTPLKWNDDIAKIARAHSRDMATGESDFGHDGFSDRVRQMKGLIAGFEGAGENVLYTSNLNQVAEQAVRLWLHSPHHLKNIRGDYNFSGIGVWESKDGTLYFTQLFLKVAEPGN